VHWQENLVTPPSEEPVTAAEVKAHARIPAAYTAEDPLITMYITAARKALEAASKRCFLRQTWAWVADQYPVGGGYYNRQIRAMGPGTLWWLPTNNLPMQMPRTPLIAVQSIVYFDANGVLTTLPPSAYDVQPGTPGRIRPVYGSIWPSFRNQLAAVTVTYDAGLADDAAGLAMATGGNADNVKLAVASLAALYYQDREMPGALPDGILALIDADAPGFYG
jgi:hypothetical protein